MFIVNPQIQTMLQKVVQLFNDGDLTSAERIAKEILIIDPKNFGCLCILGTIKSMQNKSHEAIKFFLDATRIKKNDPNLQFNLARAYMDLGKYKESLKHHRKTISLDNKNLDALVNYGKSLYEIGDFKEALICYEKVLTLDPQDYEVWMYKGIVLEKLLKYDDAINAFNVCIKINSKYSQVFLVLGDTLSLLERFEEAINSYDRAIENNPNFSQAYNNKGVTLRSIMRLDDAINHFDRAIIFNPTNTEALNNKGVTLKALKYFDEALLCFDKGLSLNPDYPEAWLNKGSTLFELKQYDEAVAHFEKALSLKPEIDWIAGDLLHTRMKICDWSGLADSFEDISKKLLANQRVIQPFPLLGLSDDVLLHKKCSEIYAQDKYPFNPTLGFIPKSVKKEKIRIAYFSPDFRNHPVSFLTAELYELHDRSRFEVFAFSLQKAPIGDETNLRLSKGFDRFIDVENMSDRDIAQLARRLEIDIAIDLAGPTQFSRTEIFSYQAAPIQVNWLGYPGTIGANFIDYIVADKTLIPESHQQYYCEKVAYLPNTYMVDDTKRVPSLKKFTRESFGLPDEAFVFCCFNNDYKFNPLVLDSWSKILLKAKNSVIWISENNENFRVNIAVEFKHRGIDPDRIIFAQRVEKMADHLSRYALADLFLDTHPYNAHTTALDSLKAGVPILTLMGQSFASRVAASLLSAIGLPELITNSQEEYESLAIELALNPHKLADIKLKLANNRLTTPLFDSSRFTKNLEAAYLKMYERYQADLKPEHITIA